jgi:hypothetical protein
MGGCEVTHCFLYKLQSKRELYFQAKKQLPLPYPTSFVVISQYLVNYYLKKFTTTIFQRLTKLLISRKIKTQQ